MYNDYYLQSIDNKLNSLNDVINNQNTIIYNQDIINKNINTFCIWVIILLFALLFYHYFHEIFKK